MTLKVKDIRKKLFSFGLDITSDQIRAMEKKGLFSSTRNNVGYRQYNENQVNDIIASIILYKIGYSVEEIIENKKSKIENILKVINKIKL